MSNPYGNDPYGNQQGGNPYGAPQGGNPYGGTPYGQYPPNPYDPGARPGGPSTDGVSIAAFILSLLCCGPVGLVLGIVGLARTKRGQRKGRWAAVAAIVIGILTTIGAAIGAVALVQFAETYSTPSNAEVGDCVDFQDETDESVTMRTKECGEPHDAEIIHQGEFDSGLIEAYDGDDTGQFCLDLLSDEHRDAFQAGPYTGGVIVEATDPDQPEIGDAFVCYAENADGDKLEGSILD